MAFCYTQIDFFQNLADNTAFFKSLKPYFAVCYTQNAICVSLADLRVAPAGTFVNGLASTSVMLIE